MADITWHDKYAEPWEFLYRVGKQAGLRDAHAELLANYAVANGRLPDTIAAARTVLSELVSEGWYDAARDWQAEGEPDTNETHWSGLQETPPDVEPEVEVEVEQEPTMFERFLEQGFRPQREVIRDTQRAKIREALLTDAPELAANEELLEQQVEQMSGMPDIEQYLADFANRNKDYRVPENYTARLRDPVTGEIKEVEPQYDVETYSWNEFQSLSFKDTVDIQTRLVKAGLLSLEQVADHWGEWFPDEAEAMQGVLTWSNFSGRDWSDQLTQLENAAAEGRNVKEETPTFIEKAYRPPDYATIVQSVKQTFEQQVGRRPREWEMQLLADELSANYRAEFFAEEDARRANETAQTQAAEGGGFDPMDAVPNHDIWKAMPFVGDLFTEETTPDTIERGPDIPQIDPYARLRESIERTYGGEVAESERVNERRTHVSDFLRTILNSV